MQIKIGSKTYTAIKDLSFSLQTDIMNTIMPINEYSADIVTDDTISVGSHAELYDDRETNSPVPWMDGMIVFAERLKIDTVTIRVQSWLRDLDVQELPAVIYSVEPIDDVLDAIFGTTDYDLDSSFSSVTITGYCPEQTARERLQWVCLCINAYVRSYNGTDIEIVPLAISSMEIIPMEKTFWRPSIQYEDYVENLKVTSFEFTAGTPAQGEEYVTVNNTDYIVTRTSNTISNPYIPSGITGKTVEISDVTLVNEDNVSDILMHLSTVYFNRVAVDMDVLDNQEYFPGDRVTFYLDSERMAEGYIESCSFSFGLQARARMHLNGVETVTGANLVISYLYDSMVLTSRRYYFPVGYSYEITNPYLDLYMNTHRYIFRPLNESATGTIASGDNTNTQNCAIALDLYKGDLYVISVDEVTENTDQETLITTGVIA